MNIMPSSGGFRSLQGMTMVSPYKAVTLSVAQTGRQKTHTLTAWTHRFKKKLLQDCFSQTDSQVE